MRSTLLVAAVLVSSLIPAELPADQSDPRLDGLFAELQSLDKRRDDRAGELQARIWSIWYENDDPAVNEAMETGLKALAQERYPEAIDAFSRTVELDPDYAEGWNRRGTTYYLMGAYQKSLHDIERVLELEPRHFAALAGRGLNLRELGRPREALQAFHDALDINPHLDRVYLEILRLRARMERAPDRAI